MWRVLLEQFRSPLIYVLIGAFVIMLAIEDYAEVRGLRIDESALTGESVPADKVVESIDEENLPPADLRNMAFMGTAVSSGNAERVVVAIGSGTQIGRISEEIEEAGTTETTLQMRIDRLAKRITAAILVVAVVAFGVGSCSVGTSPRCCCSPWRWPSRRSRPACPSWSPWRSRSGSVGWPGGGRS